MCTLVQSCAGTQAAMLLHFVSKLVCVALGALYPGYASYLALRHSARSPKHMRAQVDVSLVGMD